MSPYVLNIDQSGCGRDISKSGGHNWEVEISKVGRVGPSVRMGHRTYHYFQVKSRAKSATEPWGTMIINGGRDA
jgi:hypothetical protein